MRDGAGLYIMSLFILLASGTSAQNAGAELYRRGLNISCPDVNFRDIQDMLFNINQIDLVGYCI